MRNGTIHRYNSTLTLVHTLVTGNTAPTGPEIFNYVTDGTIHADNHNLFGFDGTAGVVGFTPGVTDIVPPEGIQLADILNPSLANNGGPTPTHALVPGSPAIDAGGPVCLDASGTIFTTDQRGHPRPVDGDGDGIAACDIGAVEFTRAVVEADVITFEGFEAGAQVSEVFGSRGSGPIFVQGTNPLLSTAVNAALVFDSACPPGGIPRDCTGEDTDLGTPHEAFGGPGVGRGGASSNTTALGKVLIIAENVEDGNGDGLVDDPDDAKKGGTLHLDFSSVGPVTVHAITFVDLNHFEPTQKVDLFRGGVTGTLVATVPLPVTGNNGVGVLPLNLPGVDTVVITLADSAAIDNITFTPEGDAAATHSVAK